MSELNLKLKEARVISVWTILSLPIALTGCANSPQIERVEIDCPSIPTEYANKTPYPQFPDEITWGTLLESQAWWKASLDSCNADKEAMVESITDR